jgi:hypothetical protein
VIVEVVYQAPVYVRVDTMTGTVVSVVVDDEGCRPDANASVTMPDNNGWRARDQVADEARDIAARAQWPAWRLGR